MLDNGLIESVDLIGKVVCFQNGYVIMRYNYSKFVNYVEKIGIGNFVFVSSIFPNRIILGQIVDIYDVHTDQEENIRSSIANNGDITSLERDIYLFIEVKIKLLFGIEGNDFIFDGFEITSRLRDVYLVSKDSRKRVFEKIFNFESVNFEKKGKLSVKLRDGTEILLKGLIFVIGNVPAKIDNSQNENIKFIGYKEFMNNKGLLLKTFSDVGTMVVKIENRSELIKISNCFVRPSFIVGENLVKTDYDILKRMIIFKSDYIPYNGLYVIYKGIIFT